ncbi:hypothetical protein [Actinomyces sp. ZJ308]|uniref:hypothetical protein n=1 Tax=Actinomyces sp. ZJ308 TaxID=2708342 RepID=UPI001FB93DA1|nr:hypothetical protein [Actinomyces sp. ZJ308]
MSSAGAGSGSTASAPASGGASAGASSSAGSGPVTAESLSDPDLGYTVVSIPEGLDATQTKILQDYIDYDKATWRLWSTGEGLDEALARSTGTTQEAIQNNAANMSSYAKPPIAIGVSNVEADADGQSASVFVCYDHTKRTVVDFDGNDITKKEKQTKNEYLITLAKNDSGTWLAESQTTVSVNQCDTKG